MRGTACVQRGLPAHEQIKMNLFGAIFGKNVANSVWVIAMPQARSYNKI